MDIGKLVREKWGRLQAFLLISEELRNQHQSFLLLLTNKNVFAQIITVTT